MELRVENLSIHYGRKVALHDCDLRLGPGVHALLGPNGAGKTSLLEALATLRKPTSGHVELDGVSGTAMRPFIGFLPQDNLKRSAFRVDEYLSYCCWLKKISQADTDQEIQRVLHMCRLEEMAHTKISNLSGGQRRRVGIASCVIGQPKLVLLDEASAGLDPEQRSNLSDIVKEIGTSSIVLTSTHIVEDIVDICDSLIIINRGSLIYQQEISDRRQLNLESLKTLYLGKIHQ